MAHRKSKKLQVRLTWTQWVQLKRAARLESELRREAVAAGAMLRDLGFPKIEERLRELETPSLRADEDRRTGDERRAAPALAAAR
jgi:hypothetical protein